MKLWIMPSKDGFSQFGCVVTNWEKCNSILEFSELVIKSDDDFVYLYGWCDSFSNVRAMEMPDTWKYEPRLIKTKIAKKDYTRNRKGQSEEVKQSMLEKAFCTIFSELIEGQPYRGRVVFNWTPMLEGVVTGVFNGKPVDEATKRIFASQIVELESISELTKFSLDDAGGDVKGSKAGYYKPSTQTEYEKLKDREKFVLEMFSQVFPDTQVESFGDVYALTRKEGDTSITALTAFELCTQLIHGGK